MEMSVFHKPQNLSSSSIYQNHKDNLKISFHNTSGIIENTMGYLEH